MSSTGASVPLAITAPDFISFCQTYAPSSARFGPRRASTNGGVRRRVDALHRGDDAEPAEPRDVGGADVLGVLDPPAQLPAVLLRVLLERLLEDVQRLAVAAVADRVHRHLVVVL